MGGAQSSSIVGELQANEKPTMSPKARRTPLEKWHWVWPLVSTLTCVCTYTHVCICTHHKERDRDRDGETKRETSRHSHHHSSRLLLILTSLSKFLQLSLGLTSDDLCVTLGQVGHAKETLIGFRSAPGSGFTWLTAYTGSALHPTLQRVAVYHF